MDKAMESSTSAVDHSKRLSVIFADGWDTMDLLEENSDPNGVEYKRLVTRARECFELCTCMVNEIDLFSSNELIDEIATESLKYILLPYFLGKVTTKRSTSTEERGEILELAEIYYKDYLQRCENCGITDGITKPNDNQKIDEEDNNHENEEAGRKILGTNASNQQLVAAAIARNEKIKRYQHKKELDKYIQRMKALVQGGGDVENDRVASDVDDEVKREFYLKLLQSSLMDTTEELKLIQMEQEMLIMRQRTQRASLEEQSSVSGTSSVKMNNKEQVRPFQPFIIARSEAQKNVFGLGYPSIPVMTVDDFYNQRVQDGIFPNAEKVAEMNHAHALAALQDPAEQEEKEKAELEKQIEDDDPQYLERMRRMDEHRDMVRRGDGNRYNRS